MASPTVPATQVTVNPSSNKSIPAPAIVVPAYVRHWALLVFITLLIVVGIARIVSIAREDHERAQMQAGKAMTLSMPPGGKSERIPVPPQMHVVMNGEDFRFHCVYQDGHEESFGKGENPCPDGNMPFVYASNQRSTESNVVSYFYASR